MSRKRFLVDMFMAMRTLLLRERPLFTIRVFRAMPFHVFVKACAVELALAVSAYAAQLKLGLWGSRPTFVAAGTMARLSQRVQMHVPRIFHFFSVGDIGQKKETCSGSDGFFCVRGCCISSNDGCALTGVASSKKQATRSH